MSSSTRHLLLPVCVAMALAGCNTAHKNIATDDPFLGEAVKYNAAIQTINPTPVYEEGAAQPGDHGEHGAKAVDRYRTDKVKPVETYTTTSGSSGPR